MDASGGLVCHLPACCAATLVPLQGKRSLYLGGVGCGARMKLVVNMTMGSMMGECVCWGGGGSR